MSAQGIRFGFGSAVKMDEVRDTLALAVIACEGICSVAEVGMDLDIDFDAQGRTCTIMTESLVGKLVAGAYSGLLSRELGESGFCICPISE